MHTIPFLHTEWLLVALVAAIVARNLLPERRWTIPLSIAGGVLLASLAAALHLIAWRGELHLAIYGVFMLAGFGAAYALIRWRGAEVGLDHRDRLDLLMIAVCAGIVGARARYVWERPELFTHDDHGAALDWSGRIALAIDFDRGGMVWYGGAVLAAAAIVIYLRARRRDLLAAGDLLIPAMLLGLGIGRVGCFFNGCCYGHPTDLPWGVACPTYPGHPVHPTQLYETVACLGVVGALMWYWPRRRATGVVFALSLIAYGLWRFTNEFLRGDDKIPSTLLGLPDTNPAHALLHDGTLPPGVLDTSQMTSLWLVVATVIVALGVHLHRRRYPAAAAAARIAPRPVHPSAGGALPSGTQPR
jgi:phosphatidylglycerol:prolipoprotein diacylglycerol transferase